MAKSKQYPPTASRAHTRAPVSDNHLRGRFEDLPHEIVEEVADGAREDAERADACRPDLRPLLADAVTGVTLAAIRRSARY